MRAFAFDIDGVLLRGGRVLPGARCALSKLNRHKIPWIVLTNGGGTLEADRCAELSERLQIKVDERQFLQSHTPFKSFVNNNNRILAIGGKQESVRAIAQRYGFPNVVTTADIMRALPDISAFPTLTSPNSVLEAFDRHSSPINSSQNLNSSEKLNSSQKFDVSQRFDAIFVFHDTYDISTDLQIVIDLLLSQNGQLATRRDPSTYTNEPSVPIYFSNGDLQWATNFALPRFGQGSFISCVKALYKAVTEGCDLDTVVIGKPTKLTYEYADRLLREWANYGKMEIGSPQNVFMVGDNQYSDIRGANAFGWSSVLVRSGVYQPSDDLFTEPTYIEGDVLQAVNKVLSR